MLYKIQLKLVTIKYAGDSVGDDIKLEIECLDKKLIVNKQIKNGTEVQIDEKIGVFYSEDLIYTLPTNIRVVEKDLVFNDVGVKKVNLKIDSKSDISQSSVHEIEVREMRNFISRKKAVFEITLEALVDPATAYVKNTDEDGWLLALKKGSRKKIDIPAYLSVRVDDIRAGRENFTILEGVLYGTQASIKLDERGNSHFSVNDNIYKESARLIYSIGEKTLKLEGKSYKATDYPGSPWEKGIYDVEIPDYSHSGGHYYPGAKHATTWFRVGHSGERYLHTGSISLGCLTIIETNRWDEIFDVLIRARKGDGQSVGTLEIVD